MNKQRLADDLDDAATYMRKHGQTTRKFVSLGGKVCAVGALRKSTTSGRANQAWRHMDQRSAKQFGCTPLGVPVGITDVNDAKMTDIPKLFRKEAARLRRNNSARKGVTRQAQKDAEKAQKKADQRAQTKANTDARQHPCVNSVPGSSSRTGTSRTLAGVALVGAAVMVWRYEVLLLTVLHYALFAALAVGALAAGYWIGSMVWDVINDLDWSYVSVWRAQRREVKAENAALAAVAEARRREMAENAAAHSELFALGPAEHTADDALKAEWTVPDEVKETVER